MKIDAHALLAGFPQLSADLLAVNLLSLGTQLDELDEAGVSLVHVDVMDGVFRSSITFGAPLLEAIPDRFMKDVHLMIDEPLGKIEPFLAAGADIITIHLGSTRHPYQVLESLAGQDVLRGVAVDPGTPLAILSPFVDELDLLLLHREHRLLEARKLIGGRPIVLAVDGGITRENIGHLAFQGANVVVAGDAIFGSGSIEENVSLLREAMTHAQRPFGLA